MTLPKYVVFGEALTDFILQTDQLWKACPGGACWNVARIGARSGVPTAFAGAVSNDSFGDELYRLTEASGLDMRFIQKVPFSPLLAIVPSTSPPQYFFVGNDSADLHFDPLLLPEGWINSVEVAHFGCISLARQPLAQSLLQLAEKLHAAGKTIAFDPNFRNLMLGANYNATLISMAKLSNYIKVSDEDLTGLFPGLKQDEALKTLIALAPQAAILLTRGSEGMTLFQNGNVIEQPAFRVDVKDTVGCGDAVMGAWMASLLLYPESSPELHLRYAAACAACTASHEGAYSPSAEEVMSFIHQQLLTA